MKGIFKIGLVGMGVSFALFLTISRGATNCANNTKYPKEIKFEIKDIVYTPKVATRLINGMLGFIGIGGLKPISGKEWKLYYKICYNNQEADWKREFSYYKHSEIIKLTVGPDLLAYINKITGLMKGLELENEKIDKITKEIPSLGLGVDLAGISLSYSGGFYMPYNKYDKSICDNGWYRMSFLGAERFMMSGKLLDYESSLLGVKILLLKASGGYVKSGMIINDRYVIEETNTSYIYSEYKLGRNTPLKRDVLYRDFFVHKLEEGVWCHTRVFHDYK